MPGTLSGDDKSALHYTSHAPIRAEEQPRAVLSSKTCILTFHDEIFSKQNVIVSPQLFSAHPDYDIVLHVSELQRSSPDAPHRRKPSRLKEDSYVRKSPEYVFVLAPVSKDTLSSFPNLEVSMLQPVAATLGFTNRSKVIVAEVGPDEHLASHVEISFKDAFLTRADMWRLLTSGLMGSSIYKNQKVLFINSVKVNIKAIYAHGRKVQSALLGPSTKAIFRSESSRYYILLQMSQEMWDFDTDGGGEIMFNKVINGFLPELFRRWESLGTTHTVSVIMFTRVKYEDESVMSNVRYYDYYRVLTTELLSSDSAAILQRLKQNFKTFLRDVSIHHATSEAPLPELNADLSRHSTISGRPTAAIHGNILEAIHTASVQFLRSNATCDLRRTGLSLIVVTPGTGVFEVDHELLINTTDVLIENGIYIDLVCLSRMPLHSSPLFRYQAAGRLRDQGSQEMGRQQHAESDWKCAIPHWVDVSFWHNGQDDRLRGAQYSLRASETVARHRLFSPRVRMYEIQMMGLMQNEFSISIPYLYCPHNRRNPKSFRASASISKKTSMDRLDDLEGTKAIYNQDYGELGSAASPKKSPLQTYMQPLSDLLDWMDRYDEGAFRPRSDSQVNIPKDSDHNMSRKGTPELRARSPERMRVPVDEKRKFSYSSSLLSHSIKRKASTASTVSKGGYGVAKANPFSRQISYSLMGFSAAKALPTTHISAEPALSNANTNGSSAHPTLSSKSSSQSLSIEHKTITATLPRSSNLTSLVSPMPQSQPNTPASEESSKPIDIVRHQQTRQTIDRPRADMHDSMLDGHAATKPVHRIQGQFSSQEWQPLKELTSPWMTMLNPSNPKLLPSDMTSRLGRWQHVFPRPNLTTTNIKWKSLCSPACVPLTTEDFPSREKLLGNYTHNTYTVTTSEKQVDSERKSNGEWLIRELIASRLTRGFSVVVGVRAAETLGLPSAQWFEFLHNTGMSKEGVKIIMSRGREIHQLLNIQNGLVEVTRYLHNDGHPQAGQSESYEPLIRTAYATNYTVKKLFLLGQTTLLDWERLDNFIANKEEEANNPYPESLQFWRARFVLIPIAVSGGRKRNHSAEDNEEEVRLEGIRKLTQMWQKNRYIPPEERNLDLANGTKKDKNPLDLVFHTRAPSAIVSELSDSILAEPSEQTAIELLPESDLFEISKINLALLAKTMQGERGVRLLDRRWHWRLHYNCFVGLEFVTWMVNNFRDIDTREEAEEFGNKLMKEGLFVHVEKRHNFRDGNFFYQIADKYRLPRADVKSSWFGRLAERSVPQTPVVEGPEEVGNSPHAFPSYNSTNGDELENKAEDGQPRKTRVMLSKRLVYDIDPRRRSERRELIHLHFDRISPADDCYHIRIDWVTATPKLLEDTIESWTTIAERSGLRLVEVPLLEACRFQEVHPFRQPYFVKLIKEPPDKEPQRVTVDAGPLSSGRTTATQHGQQIKWPYHKAILKKFDFVLDLEAASEFPPHVDVSYSWGKPDYAFPQYISRNGRMLAQITNDGQFLLLINQLFVERGAAAREAHRSANTTVQNGRSPLASGPPTAGLGKITHSPFASPMLKAVVEQSSSLTGSPLQRPVSTISDNTAVLDLRQELVNFCGNAEALEKFYEEELHRPLATVPATPAMHPDLMTSVPVEGALPTFSLKEG